MFEASLLECRIRFLQRATSTSIVTGKALAYDHEVLASQRVGFSHDLFVFLSTYFDASRIEESSLTDIEYLQDLRDEILLVRNEEFRSSFRRSTGLSFLIDLTNDAIVPRQFGEFLGSLDYEEARIVLLFLGDVFRFSMSATSSDCPFCPVQLHASHLFLRPNCPFTLSLPRWQDFLGHFHQARWSSFVVMLFLCLQVWMENTHFFQPRFRGRITGFLSFQGPP